jgi:Bacterial PH domain
LAFGPILWAISIGALVVWLVLLRQEATKIVVIDRRMNIKRGLRLTVHINVRQIESIDVTQPYLGMMLNYGIVSIRGSGGSRERAETIADPFRLRIDLGTLKWQSLRSQAIDRRLAGRKAEAKCSMTLAPPSTCGRSEGRRRMALPQTFGCAGWPAPTASSRGLRAARVEEATLGFSLRFNAAAIANVSSLPRFNVAA